MADIKGKPVQSTGVYVDDLGVVQYMVNGERTTRDDFNALNMSRIAAALEVLAEDALEADGEAVGPDEGDAPKPPTADNLFGV
jgi:hypothetical protein